MEKTKVTKDLEAKTLTIERTFDGSKDKVWKAYTDKEWFVKWWGPEGWETKVKEFNFVSGGRVHYGMKCVDERQGEWFGQESWGVMEIESVEGENSYTYIDYFADADGNLQKDMPGLKITNTFSEEDGKTTIVSVSYADSAEDIEKLLAMGMIEGYDSQLRKLDELLVAN